MLKILRVEKVTYSKTSEGVKKKSHFACRLKNLDFFLTFKRVKGHNGGGGNEAPFELTPPTPPSLDFGSKKV